MTLEGYCEPALSITVGVTLSLSQQREWEMFDSDRIPPLSPLYVFFTVGTSNHVTYDFSFFFFSPKLPDVVKQLRNWGSIIQAQVPSTQTIKQYELTVSGSTGDVCTIFSAGSLTLKHTD